MAFINSNDTSKRYTTKYGEPYLYFSGDVTTLPSNKQTVTASDGANNDRFGQYVNISSGKILVSAPSDDDGGTSSGSAYIYDLDGSGQIKITASDAASSDHFGQKSNIGQGRIVVGAWGDDDIINSVGGSTSGSAYIFDLKGTQLTKLNAPDASSSDNFGFGCAVGSGRIVVGAYDDSRTTPYTHHGSIYLYDLSGTYLRKIIAPDESNPSTTRFGETISIGCGRIVVYAGATNSFRGVNFIYDVDGNLIKKIDTPSSIDSDYARFGDSISVSQGRIVFSSSRGKFFIYDLDGNLLKEITKTDESNFGFGSAPTQFGSTVAVGSGRIVTRGDNYIIVFDLDGNYIGKVDVGASFSSISIRCGKIACGNWSSGNGVVYSFDTPRVYTPYDFIYNEA
jgi:hypothetical protein